MKKRIYASVTILATFEVDENMDNDDIDIMINKAVHDYITIEPPFYVNDIEWD